MGNYNYPVIGPVIKRITKPITKPTKNPKRGGRPPEYLSFSATQGSGSGVKTIAKPSGMSVGDLLVIMVQTRNGSTASPGAGTWTQKMDYQVNSGSIVTPAGAGNDVFRVWQKVADADDVAAANFTLNITSASTWYIIYCIAFSGVSNIYATSAGSSQVSPSVTTVGGKSILVAYHATAFDNSIFAVPSPAGGNQVLIEDFYDATNDVGLVVAYEYSSGAGATGTRTWTNNFDNYDISGILAIQ